jgi:hypothetical protein
MALVITKISEINRAISSTIRPTTIAFCIFVSISNGPLKSLTRMLHLRLNDVLADAPTRRDFPAREDNFGQF